MKLSIKHMNNFRVHATDKEIGHTDNYYFDDERWVIRYFVISTGNMLTGSTLPISPILIKEVNWENKEIFLFVASEVVKQSPDVDTKAPISRKIEATLSEHYGYPIYWGGIGLWGGVMTPRALARKMTPEEERDLLHEKESDNSHLRSAYEVTGYRVQASDGDIGHVKDFIINEKSWDIAYIVVDTKNWLPGGKKVIIEPQAVEGISWSNSKVYMNMERDGIKNSPEVHTVLP